jgi:hypothetical protein
MGVQKIGEQREQAKVWGLIQNNASEGLHNESISGNTLDERLRRIRWKR